MAKRKVSLRRNCLSILAMLTFMIVIGQPASADYTYCNDFEGDPAKWTEWIFFIKPSYGGAPGPPYDMEPAKQATTPSGRHFLGRHPVYGFDNVIAVLTLPAVPAGSLVTVDFELFTILTWDGIFGAQEFWKLYTGDGQSLLFTTFGSAPGVPQSYPDNYPSNHYHPGQTGSISVGSLGYWIDSSWGDVIYNIDKSFYHKGGDVVINFEGLDLQGVGDESWGLDNVLVTVNTVPVPGTLILLGSGLLFVAGLIKRIR